jgi:hypothetical protein
MRVLPGAASTAVRDLLTGPPRAGRVVGVHLSCVYVVAGRELVALETADGLGLPCAVRVGVDRSAAPFTGLRQGDAALVGAGQVVAGPLTVPVARWLQPPRTRPGKDASRVAPRVTATAGLLAAHPCPVDTEAAVDGLVGLGPGLTPAGDDVLAGLLVGLHHHETLRAPLAADVDRLAAGRTTTLSAELLRHAADGLAMPAVVAVADALAGHGSDGDLEAAVARLVAVGHSSGTALAHGLLRAARTVLRTVEEAA